MRRREFGGEEQEGSVRSAEVTSEEDGEDGASEVERGGVRRVRDVPGVFEVCEERRRVPRAEGEVPFGVVGFAFCAIRQHYSHISNRARLEAYHPRTTSLPRDAAEGPPQDIHCTSRSTPSPH